MVGEEMGGVVGAVRTCSGAGSAGGGGISIVGLWEIRLASLPTMDLL